MNPGEPAPTALQRWVSRHRTGVRAGDIVLMAVSVLFGVDVLATEGLNGSIGGAVGGVGGLDQCLDFNCIRTSLRRELGQQERVHQTQVTCCAFERHRGPRHACSCRVKDGYARPIMPRPGGLRRWTRAPILVIL